MTEGRDGVGEVPAKRWEPYVSSDPQNAATLRHCSRYSAFLDDVEGFNSAFFGISPRETLSIDPRKMFLKDVQDDPAEI